MKIQFKHQAFQRDAAQAVVNAFRGQPLQDFFAYRRDVGKGVLALDAQGFRNHDILLNDEELTRNIREVQISQELQPVNHVLRDGNGTLALSIEMETGTGKTYTYIKTMYELNKHYGWTKFIIVVPSVAIREGVIKSLETMADHFAEEYGERMQHFVYDSAHPKAIDQFASDPKIHVMVINTQAFNATGKDARRIFMKLEDFNYRRPIDILSETRPILIIDEPQSVLGTDKKNKTRQGLQQFNPLFSLLYSATHRKADVYNQVYRLDAIDVFNKRLVKKIEVMGVEQIGTTATNGHLYLDAIVLSKKKGEAPRARISFDATSRVGLRTATRLVDEGFDLYAESGELEAYRDGFIIERIDGVKGCIRLSNGQEIYEGQAMGAITEELIRRIQIRTTIQKHFEREHQLYKQGIKVLSLFFIDAVEKYRIYDSGGETRKGRWAEIFEEEYVSVLNEVRDLYWDEEYKQYLQGISAEQTHAGYFSQDKKGKMIDSKVKRGETEANDPDAYQLIMRNKERLLSLDEPTRFIFSHSALKEGWDNPNVFQICALKQSNNEVKKRQEVGRGMRLCVNQQGERQDSDLLGDAVYDTKAMTRSAIDGNFKPNDDYEKMQFYYHPDHLGSSSYITNLDGEVAQHIEYVPFGEVFIEERNNTWNTPYLFNAKEFDKETGLYYYGARYMDPKISMWLGVDPMAEKYPNLTGYCYTMDNPIILIDPTGMEPDGWGGKNNENGTTTYTYDAKVTADNYSQLGYDVYKPNGSIINNATINGQTGENGQTSVYLGNNANDVSFTWPNSTVTPFQVGTEWLTGKGPRHRDFTNGDLFTEMLKKHEHIEDTRNMIINNVMNGGALKGTNPYKLGGIEGVGLYIRDYSTLITGGLTGNLAVTYLGSYNLDWVAKPNAENGTISVTFSIYNTSTMQSASRPPILGYLPIWQKTVGSMINKKFKKGWGSITSQSFRWTETLQMRR